MNFKIVFILFFIVLNYWAFAQVTTPTAAELIGVHNVSTSEISNILDVNKGSIIYNTDVDRIYLYDGSKWLKLVVEKEIVKSISEDYTLSATDNGMALIVDSDSEVILTIPSGLELGYNISVYQTGVGKVKFQGSGTILKNRLSRFKTAGKDAGVGILCTSINTFHLTGDLKK